LLAIDPYEGDLDFGTNYMGVDAGGTPNIFETEIHGGLYRGTILIELDAVGKNRDGEGLSAADPKKGWELKPAEKCKRVDALLTALQHLWSSGRQSRFLADISPKFVAAAATTAKVPLFLESVRRESDGIDTKALEEALADAKAITTAHCFGARAGLFDKLPEDCQTVGEAFDTMRGWVKDYYGA
jgi:CRISPR-associated protein Cst2